MMIVALFAVVRQNVSADELAVAVLVLGGVGTRHRAQPDGDEHPRDGRTDPLGHRSTRQGPAGRHGRRGAGVRRHRARPAADRVQPHGRATCANASGSATSSAGTSARTWPRRRCRGRSSSAARCATSPCCSSTSSAPPRSRPSSRPQEVVKLLNRFFAVVVAEVHEHGGFVNKFEGDAVLAVFGAPEDMDDAAGQRPRGGPHDDRPAARRGARGRGRRRGVRGAGGRRQRRRREPVRVHRDRRPGQRGGPACPSTPRPWTAVSSRPMRAVEAAGPEEAERWREVDEVQLRGRVEPTRIAVPVDGGS